MLFESHLTKPFYPREYLTTLRPAPIVSVIIPAYNAEATIERAVASALAQDVVDIEVIVIDDGSTDRTAAVARDAGHDDPRLRIVQQTNGGVSAARNAGLDHAGAEWVAPLDADDAFVPTRIARLLEVADRTNADLVADNMLITAADGSSTHAFPDDRMSEADPIDIISYIFSDRPRQGLNSAGFIKPLMRRAFLEEHDLRYRVAFSVSEDFDLYTRCLLHGARLFYIPDALYLYTHQTSSLSHGDDKAIVAEIRRIGGLMIAEARSLGRIDVVEELQRREEDTASWIASLDFERAVGRLDLARAVRLFLQLPSKPYGVYRVLSLIRYNALRAMGRTPRPRKRR